MATPGSIFNVDSHGLNANRMLIRHAERRRVRNKRLPPDGQTQPPRADGT